MDKEKKEVLYKILLLGDSSVVKKCFLMHYIDNKFKEIHMLIIYLDYKLKKVQWYDRKNIKMQIWDTENKDRLKSIKKNYYKGANGIILIYDITNRKTFENVSNWINQIKEEVSEKVTIILVGNKIDDEEHRAVQTEEGKNLAKELGLMFFECSAKSGENIDSTFNELVKKTVENYTKVNKGDHLRKGKNGKKGCC